jgi:hypothetical protein
MAVDFKEDKDKPRLATCATHNLKYDPATTWGCVLCRKKQTRRISGYAVVGGVLIAAAAVFLAVQMMAEREVTPPPVIRCAKSRAAGSGNRVEQKAIDCLTAVSQKVEACVLGLAGKEDVQMDRELCLDPFMSLNETCPGAYSLEDSVGEAIYSSGDGPAWPDVRAALEAVQEEIEKCVESGSYDFGMRLTVAGTTGAVEDVILSNAGFDTPARRFCVSEVIRTLTFPSSGAGTYTVAAMLNSDILSRNRLEKDDPRKAEFQKFLSEQRVKEAGAAQREALQREREEKNRQYEEAVRANSSNP